MACAGNWRSEERRHRRNIRQHALAPPTRDRSVSAVEKTWGLAAGHGTLCGSLGLVTGDSPKGSVCSSSPRGITPRPSRCLIKYAANAIEIVGRAYPGNLTRSVFEVLNEGCSSDAMMVAHDWELISTSQWPLSYRNDSRNWRLSNQQAYRASSISNAQ